AAASADGSATTTSAIAGDSSSASTLRSRIARPPSSRNCFGTAVPRRVPWPPAATMAATRMIAGKLYDVSRALTGAGKVLNPPCREVEHPLQLGGRKIGRREDHAQHLAGRLGHHGPRRVGGRGAERP